MPCTLTQTEDGTGQVTRIALKSRFLGLERRLSLLLAQGGCGCSFAQTPFTVAAGTWPRPKSGFDAAEQSVWQMTGEKADGGWARDSLSPLSANPGGGHVLRRRPHPTGRRSRGCWADGTPVCSRPPQGTCPTCRPGACPGSCGHRTLGQGRAPVPTCCFQSGPETDTSRVSGCPLPATHTEAREPQDRGPGLERASQSRKLSWWLLVWLCRCREMGLVVQGEEEGGDSERCSP